MQIKPLVAFAPIAVLVSGIMLARPSFVAQAAPTVAHAIASSLPAPSASAQEVPAPSPPSEPEGTGKLAGYVLEAMLSWKKPPIGATLAVWARDIAIVSLQNPPLWETDVNRGKTAILLTTLFFFEGAFLPFVVDGRCNSKVWRDKAYAQGILWSRAACDAGWAFSGYQIHPEGGIEITPDGEANYKFGAIGGKDLIADNRLATRVALAMVRKSLRVTRGLCGYTGDGEEGCSKAKMRSNFASDHSRRHPFAP